jgi:hypothetical protein
LAKVLDDIVQKSLDVDLDYPDADHRAWTPSVTSDCGANISKALDGGLTVQSTFWIKCSLHILHNVVKAGIAALDCAAISKCKAFVTHISRSKNAAGNFRQC